MGFPGSTVIKNLPASAGAVGDLGSAPQSGRFPWRSKWQPTPVFLLGKPHGQRSLAGCSPWGCKQSDMTERLSTQMHKIDQAFCKTSEQLCLPPCILVWASSLLESLPYQTEHFEDKNPILDICFFANAQNDFWHCTRQMLIHIYCIKSM